MNCKTFSKGLLAFLCASLVNGCAVGRKIDYQQGTIPLNVTKELQEAPIAAVVQDRRPYVLDGSHSNTFVGTQRSLFGVPWAMHTESNLSLAEDFKLLITKSLKAKNVDVLTLGAQSNDSDTEAIKKLTSVTPNRTVLLFKLNDWQSDHWFGDDLSYCMELTVIPPRTQCTETTSQCGKITMSADPTHFGNLGISLVTIFERLINSSELTKALACNKVKEKS